MNNIKF